MFLRTVFETHPWVRLSSSQQFTLNFLFHCPVFNRKHNDLEEFSERRKVGFILCLTLNGMFRKFLQIVWQRDSYIGLRAMNLHPECFSNTATIGFKKG